MYVDVCVCADDREKEIGEGEGERGEREGGDYNAYGWYVCMYVRR